MSAARDEVVTMPQPPHGPDKQPQPASRMTWRFALRAKGSIAERSLWNSGFVMLSLIVAATLFVGIQEQPQGEPQAEPQTEAAATRDGEADRVICRREHVVGSNRPQRICM